MYATDINIRSERRVIFQLIECNCRGNRVTLFHSVSLISSQYRNDDYCFSPVNAFHNYISKLVADMMTLSVIICGFSMIFS